jgi:F420-non-reducing hydrogenase iron-sulfur subunit
MSFEPRLVGFLCNWCSYTGADLAGTARLKYPPNLRVIRVMCSGRVDPNFILDALVRGADGVLVCGCHPGDCHYAEGNYKCQSRLPITRRIVEGMGVDPRRVRLEWVSASEGARFAEVVKDFTNQVRALGPLHLQEWAFDRAAAEQQLEHA